MEHQAPAIFVWLEQSAFAAAIRQSVWLYPAANIGHIVALFCFAGAVTVMDVRLLGGLAAIPPGPLIARARRFAIGALAAMAVTGFMLFSAEASHIVLNPVFQLKFALIGAGLVNVALFEFGAKHAIERLAPGAVMPRQARMVGLTSLVIWIAVAACGRSIAYF
jgi:hypothetical protein